jgi:hypothetical protein
VLQRANSSNRDLIMISDDQLKLVLPILYGDAEIAAKMMVRFTLHSLSQVPFLGLASHIPFAAVAVDVATLRY